MRIQKQPDSFDTLSDAAKVPSLENQIKMMDQLDGVFSGLHERFPTNVKFKQYSKVIRTSRTILYDLSSNHENLSREEFDAGMTKIKDLFTSAGAKKQDLAEWGLL